MDLRLPAAALAGLLSFCVASNGAGAPWFKVTQTRSFPPPSSQSAAIAVDGNSSTPQSPIDVAKAARPGAASLSSGDFVRDTTGFQWFCSRHYALKSDMPDGDAAGVLALLELAWPHYAALFGAVPANGGTVRMTLVAASSRDSLKRAMIDDCMFAFTLGGVTQEGYGAAYLYAGAPYQTRYIVLHEATHLFQYCLSGNTRGTYGFFVEGIADLLSSHVFDPEVPRLTVNMLDRAPIHNHLADGLAEWRERGRPSFSALYGDASLSRPLSVLLAAYLQGGAAPSESWERYCHRTVLRGGGPGAKSFSDALLAELYEGGSIRTNGETATFPTLDAGFGDWIRALSPSYRLLGRDFDQEGGRFVSGFPASCGEPAVLEGATDGLAGMSVRWRTPPEAGAFAKVELLDGDGAPGGRFCIITNTGRASMLMHGGGGRPAGNSGGRLLAARIASGSAIPALDIPDPGFRRWRLTASQPGIEFTPHGEGGQVPVAVGKDARPPMRPQGLSPRVVHVDGPIRGWKALGPFALPGQKFAHPSAPPPSAAPDLAHTLDDGTFALWRDAAMNSNPAFSQMPIANLTRTFGRQANNSFAYLAAEIDCPAECERRLVLGVSDGIEVFVNGECVLDDVRQREWEDANVSVPVRFRKGRNVILLRLSHATGVWLLGAGLI